MRAQSTFVTLFTAIRFSENDPIRMLAAGMMSSPPLWVYNWSLAYLNDAITGGKSDILSCTNQIYVRPLITMVMYIICNLTQKNTIVNECAPGLNHEIGIGMSEAISIVLRRSSAETK